MAYIDKDKALNLDFRINVNLFESRRKTAERAVQAYADAINAIPAADVRPVVRGKWALCLKGEIACTNCGSRSKRKTNYCPNCGVDMRGEADEKA